MIIEVNNCHVELLPSIVKYLEDLDYTAEVISLPAMKGFLPLIDVKKFYLMIKEIKKILLNKKISKYDFVFFLSYKLYCKAPDKTASFSYLNEHFGYLKNIKTKFGTIAIVHHKENIENAVHQTGNAIVLSKILRDNCSLKDNVYVVNPCYFKNKIPKDKNAENIKFITIGALEIQRKNPQLLLNGAKELIKNGFTNFEFIVVGDDKKIKIPKQLKKFIKLKGRLNFENMYKELDSANFYLPLLDFNIKEHLRYIQTGTSGSFQLITGFLIPPVIQKQFALPHGFNKNNALLYNTNEDFFKALISAITMPNPEYKKLQSNLLEYKHTLETRSKKNLSSLIGAVQMSKKCFLP